MQKRKLFGVVYGIILVIFTVYIILDTFVVGEVYTVVSSNINLAQTVSYEIGEVKSTENSYEDNNIKISISEYEENATVIHVADVQINDATFLLKKAPHY